MSFRNKSGGTRPGPPSCILTRWIFLRSLGMIYLVAFLSLGSQIPGLIGKNGILPAGQFFGFIRENYGAEAIWRFPSLALLGGGDGFLSLLCWCGVASSVLVIAGIAPTIALALSWLSYLSLFVAGQEFLSFQWDILLLETGFLAIFFAPLNILPGISKERPPSNWFIWMFRLLLFRLMFFSGFVKLASGDPSWRDLTTLTFHFETQPLPTPLAWYAHQAPGWLLVTACAVMFVLELAVPFLFFASRRLRFAACGAVSAFMVLITLTGNYTFFNFLTIALCLLLLDDSALRALLPEWASRRIGGGPPPEARRRLGPGRHLATGVLAGLILFLNVVQFSRVILGRELLPGSISAVANWFGPFCLVNRYGLFAVMTRPRGEIVIEGSNDGASWQEYEFKYKPGDVYRPLPWVAPHQPRLDWQMWFAALGTYQENKWFVSLCVRLLQGSREVLDLIEKNPFPDRPPKYIRAILYEYHFTDFATKTSTRAWWKQDPRGLYLPAISLKGG